MATLVMEASINRHLCQAISHMYRRFMSVIYDMADAVLTSTALAFCYENEWHT